MKKEQEREREMGEKKEEVSFFCDVLAKRRWKWGEETLLPLSLLPPSSPSPLFPKMSPLFIPSFSFRLFLHPPPPAENSNLRLSCLNDSGRAKWSSPRQGVPDLWVASPKSGSQNPLCVGREMRRKKILTRKMLGQSELWGLTYYYYAQVGHRILRGSQRSQSGSQSPEGW